MDRGRTPTEGGRGDHGLGWSPRRPRSGLWQRGQCHDHLAEEGSGKEVAKGAKVTVHATGVVKETGKKFWSTKDPGQEPFTYNAGVGQVIKGWDQGLLGMKLGAWT